MSDEFTEPDLPASADPAYFGLSAPPPGPDSLSNLCADTKTEGISE